MQTYTASEAKARFGEFLDRVQRKPVRVMRHGRVVGGDGIAIEEFLVQPVERWL